MGAYQLQLKKRINKATMSVPLAGIVEILSLPEDAAKDRLYTLFSTFKPSNVTMHDKYWLEMIVNWSPKGGLKMTDLAKWMKLAQRVVALDDSVEGTFSLSQYQVDLIWERLNDTRFAVEVTSSSFLEFVADFLAVTGKKFNDEDPTE